MTETIKEHILEKDAHTTGDFICLDFDSGLHLVPSKFLPADWHFLKKGVRIRVTYDSQPAQDPLVNSLVPTILKVSLVSPTPEVYHVIVETHFPQRVQQAIADQGTVVQVTRVR